MARTSEGIWTKIATMFAIIGVIATLVFGYCTLFPTKYVWEIKRKQVGPVRILDGECTDNNVSSQMITCNEGTVGERIYLYAAGAELKDLEPKQGSEIQIQQNDPSKVIIKGKVNCKNDKEISVTVDICECVKKPCLPFLK